jgi:hypothetical protein
VNKSILDKKVVVGEQAVLGTGLAQIANKENPHHLACGLIVVGKGAEIPARFRVGKNSILYPLLKADDYLSPEIAPGETVRPRQIEE